MIIFHGSEISIYKVKKETFYYTKEYQGLGEISRKIQTRKCYVEITQVKIKIMYFGKIVLGVLKK